MKTKTKAYTTKVESMKRIKAAYDAAVKYGTVKHYIITIK